MKFGTLSLLLFAACRSLSAADVPLVLDVTQSRVDVAVKATVDSFVGRLENYDAMVTVDPATAQVTGARVAFHFSDVKTGNPDRDEQMHDWQGTTKNPDGVFVLAGLARAADGTQRATGALTFHGQEKEISFPVAVTHEGERYAIDGDATLDTRGFGLPIIRKFMFLKVDPEVHVRFHLQGSVPVSKN
jgi:polyisoprenoid-binding protein YceI